MLPAGWRGWVDPGQPLDRKAAQWAHGAKMAQTHLTTCDSLLFLARFQEVRWLYPLETSTSERELPLHITCSLCGEEEVERFTYGADKRALKCGCAVCGDCFTSWCVAKVDDMCATIKCPMGSRAVSSRRACLDPVPQEAVQHALQLMPEHRRKYMMVCGRASSYSSFRAIAPSLSPILPASSSSRDLQGVCPVL